MPLIICPDCNKEMSDAAPACPGCGRSNATSIAEPKRSVSILLGVGIFLMPYIFSWFTLRKGYSNNAKIISFVWLAVVVVAYAAGGEGSKSASSASSSPAASVNEQPSENVMQVEIHKILSDYEGNEVAADNLYKGNLVQVTGIVDDIKKDIMDNLYVTLGTGQQFEIPQVQAFFDDSMNSQLGSLQKGQNLTVVCNIKGLMMNVLGEDCAIK